MKSSFLHLHVRVNAVLALIMMRLLWLGAEPLPSLAAEEGEMEMGVAPARGERGGEEVLRMQFTQDYEAAQEEPRAVFAKYLPVLSATALVVDHRDFDRWRVTT